MTEGISDKIQVNPQGWVALDLPRDKVRLRLGFSELADADEFLGRSTMSALAADPMNMHTLRVLFYFASRKLNKTVKSMKGAGEMLEGAELEIISEGLFAALRQSGLIPETEEEPAGE
jgi:hypothetical protein